MVVCGRGRVVIVVIEHTRGTCVKLVVYGKEFEFPCAIFNLAGIADVLVR